MKTKQELLNERAMHLKAARDVTALCEKEGRDFTEAEAAEVQAALGKVRALNDEIKALNDPDGEKQKAANDEIRRFVLELGGEIDNPKRGPGKGGAWSKAFFAARNATGRKELLPLSGSVSVGQLSSTIGTLSDNARAESVLQLIPIVPAGGDAFSYLRETVRQHAARPVAIGERKPQSTYELERIDDRVRTIAHLSPGISKNWLTDAPMLGQYLDGVLREGIIQELEFQIFQGTGTDEDLPGILATANVQVQLFDTDILTTTRKAITLLETRPITPTGWAMNPLDWETLELTRVSGGELEMGPDLPIERARRRLWGLPVALTLGVPAGKSVLADWRSAVALLEHEGVRIDWTDAFAVEGNYDELHSTGFQRNLIQFRAEGRWGLSETRPPAIVEVDMEAGS